MDQAHMLMLDSPAGANGADNASLQPHTVRQFGTQLTNNINTTHQNNNLAATNTMNVDAMQVDKSQHLPAMMHGMNLPGGGDHVPQENRPLPGLGAPRLMNHRGPQQFAGHGQAYIQPSATLGLPYFSPGMIGQYQGMMMANQYPGAPMDGSDMDAALLDMANQATTPESIKDLMEKMKNLTIKMDEQSKKHDVEIVEIRSKLDVSMKKLADAISKLEVLEAAAGGGGDDPSGPSATTAASLPRDVSKQLKNHVRSAMCDLLLLDEGPTLSGDDNSNKADQIPLPDPLLPGEPYRTAPDGTRVFNPDWNKGPTKTALNMEYITAAIKLALVRAKADETYGLSTHSILEDRKFIRKAALQYFQTLRDRYRSQTSAVGLAKKKRANTINKIRNRKRAKAALMRKMVPVAAAHLGEEATQGYMELIQTDWQSSEHSDCGKMAPEEFKRYRESHIGQNAGWEVRPLMWRTRKIMMLYLYLRKLHRDQNEQPETARNRKSKAKKGPVTSRFPAAEVNENYSAPVPAKGTIKPYRSCVSTAWAAKTNNTDLVVAQDPAEFTILQTGIPEVLLGSQDLAYLARYND